MVGRIKIQRGNAGDFARIFVIYDILGFLQLRFVQTFAEKRFQPLDFFRGQAVFSAILFGKRVKNERFLGFINLIPCIGFVALFFGFQHLVNHTIIHIGRLAAIC